MKIKQPDFTIKVGSIVRDPDVPSKLWVVWDFTSSSLRETGIYVKSFGDSINPPYKKRTAYLTNAELVL